MPDDAPELDLPDAETVNAHYLETCRHSRIEAVSHERARALMAEWSDAIAAGRLATPTKD